MRQKLSRLTGNNPLILLVIGLLMFFVSRAVVRGSYPFLLITFVTIGFIMVMIYKPDQLVNVYICTTFFLLLYLYFNQRVPIFALDSVKDYFLIWLWIFLVYKFLLNRSPTDTFKWQPAVYNIVSLLFFIYIFMQIFRAGEMRVGIFGFRKTAEFMTIFWFVQIFYNNKKKIKSLEKTFLSVALLGAVIGLGQRLSGYYIDPRIITLGGVSFKRVTSTYGNPNTFADILLTGIILFFNHYLFGGFSRWKIVYFTLALVILGMAFLFTYSVSGFVALLGGLSFLFLFHRRNFKRKFLLVVSIGSILIAVLILTPLYAGRISRLESKIGQPETYDQLARYVLWHQCIALWKQSPLFGIGYGKVGGRLHWRTTDVPLIVDNSYMILLTQYGLVGIILFAIILATVFWRAFQNRRCLQDAYLKQISQGITVILFSYCLIAFPLNLWEMMFPINFLFWLFAGILVKLPAIDRALQIENESGTASRERNGE